MKYSNKLFASIFEDCDTTIPDIDVEINICDTDSTKDKIDDISNEIEKDMEVLDKSQEYIEEAEILVKILKEDGISTIALKTISTNKLYTDIWKIHIPSVESLNTHSSKVIANNLIDVLTEKINKAEAGIEGLWDTIKEKMGKLWNWFTDLFRNEEEKVNRMANKVANLELDQDKVNKKIVKCWDIETINKLFQETLDILNTADNLIIDPSTGKITNELGEKIRDFISKKHVKEIRKEKEEKPLADIANDITSGKQGELYKSVIRMNNIRVAYEALINKINKALNETLKLKKEEDKNNRDNNGIDDGLGITSGIGVNTALSIGKAVVYIFKKLWAAYVGLLRWIENYGRKRIVRLMEAIVDNYLTLGNIVYDCRIKESN